MCIRDRPRGVAMSRVMITMYSVFIIFPRIPKVPFVALEAVLKNAHVTCGIPRTNTYPMMPARRRMEKPAQVYMMTVRNTSRPVSYTHLDVYKRQILSTSRSISLAGAALSIVYT